MANTVIALKKSSTPAATPSSLANGELAINFADGKIFYKAANGTIVSFSSGGGSSSNSFATINANNTLVVADSDTDILTLNNGNNITIVGDAVNDKITIGLVDNPVIPGTLHIQAQGGIEGGQIELGNATSSSTLAGNVVIDIYGNKLRFYEKDSPNKGAFIDLSIAGSGVSSNLLVAAAGGSTDTTARATAEAAFAKANAALPNTDGVTFAGTLTVTANLVADRFISLNNGNGENYKVGDDAWIGDTNLANTIRIKGQQNPSHGYIMFGDNDGTLLGRNGTNALTYGGSTVWHAGNDGSGSGLDADLLDGNNSSYFATASALSIATANINYVNTAMQAAFDKANTGGGGGASVNVSETGPTSPTVGSLWWNSNTGKLLIYYTDVDATSQWVEAYGSGGGTEPGSIALAYDQANVAFVQANIAVANVNYVNTATQAAYAEANNRATVGKAIAMAMVFGG